MQELKWKINEMPKTEDKNLPLMSMEEVKKARTFHESFPQYTKTPLQRKQERIFPSFPIVF